MQPRTSPSIGLRQGVRRRPGDQRAPVEASGLAAFLVFLLAAAGFSVWSSSPAVGVALLGLLAAIVSWSATVPGAVVVGTLAWLFYSGFVTHAQGHLGIFRIGDGIAAVVLLAASLTPTLLHLILLTISRRRFMRRVVAPPRPSYSRPTSGCR